MAALGKESIADRTSRIAAGVGALAALTACADLRHVPSPSVPVTTSYTAGALPEATTSADTGGGAAQRFVAARDIPAEWWQLFRSEQLDSLIRAALAASPTLTAARAALRQAHENYRAQRGSTLYPDLNANLSGRRQQTTGAQFGQPQAGGNQFNLYDASVDVSYSLDAAGGSKSELDVLRSEVDYQCFQLEGAYLTLTGNIATGAVHEASLRAQIDATRQIIDVLQAQLDIMERQFSVGAIANTVVLAQRAELAQVRATIPPLENQLAQARHLLATLAGKPTSDANMPVFTLEDLDLPVELPVSVPSALITQRPDVRAAEALVTEAAGNVGIAAAALFPQITLSARYGSDPTRASDLFAGGTTVWNLGVAMLQPIFRGGQLRAQHRAALAAYDQAAAQYEGTVLLAFRNVADVLRALETDARSLQAQADAERAARASLDVVTEQYMLGAVSYLSLLSAERQYEQALVGLEQARGTRYADTVALFQAMGGGWWNATAAPAAGCPH